VSVFEQIDAYFKEVEKQVVHQTMLQYGQRILENEKPKENE
jgi:hypothetical protein